MTQFFLLTFLFSTAVLLRGNTLYLFYTRVYDAPECVWITKVRVECGKRRLNRLHTSHHILRFSQIDLTKPWKQWSCPVGTMLLQPELTWEGADLPIQPSYPGDVYTRTRELRDPDIYVEGDKVYLVYTYAGESGLAIAELDIQPFV